MEMVRYRKWTDDLSPRVHNRSVEEPRKDPNVEIRAFIEVNRPYVIDFKGTRNLFLGLCPILVLFLLPKHSVWKISHWSNLSNYISIKKRKKIEGQILPSAVHMQLCLL